MFEHVKYRYQLAKKLRKHRQTDAAFDEEVKAAKAAKRTADLHEIDHRRRWELETINDEIGILSSRYWQARAHRYQVGLPNGADNWIHSRQLGESYLSTGATAKIRADIRAEQKATWDWWQSRVTLVLSIFGSVIGVLAYIKK